LACHSSSVYFSIALLTRRKKWLRRLAVGFFLAGLLAGGLIWFAAGNLTAIAKWGIRRALPGVKVELGSLKFESRAGWHSTGLHCAIRIPEANLSGFPAGASSFRSEGSGQARWVRSDW